jgi:pimeloyl-ACP methyl ester carboxylesterase
MSPKEKIILLHGLGRTPLSMLLLAWRLRQCGYEVFNFGYASMFRGIPEHAEKLKRYIEKKLQERGVGPFYLVGHSLGSLVARYYAGHFPSPHLKRLVMLAPPNQSPRLVHWLQGKVLLRQFFRLITGKSGQQIGDPKFYEENFPPCNYPVGVIAGDCFRGDPHLPVYNQPNDLILGVDETKFKTMTSWVSIHSGHTFIMDHRQTAQLVVCFLRNGDFNSPAGD